MAVASTNRCGPGFATYQGNCYDLTKECPPNTNICPAGDWVIAGLNAPLGQYLLPGGQLIQPGVPIMTPTMAAQHGVILAGSGSVPVSSSISVSQSPLQTQSVNVPTVINPTNSNTIQQQNVSSNASVTSPTSVTNLSNGSSTNFITEDSIGFGLPNWMYGVILIGGFFLFKKR